MEQGKHQQKARLPESFRSLMWSYRFEDIDVSTHKKTIVLQAVNYGTLEHWQWITKTYGKSEVRDVLRQVPVTSIRRHVRKLVSLMFDISQDQFNHAPRGAH